MKQMSAVHNLTPLWKPVVILPSQVIDRRLALMPEMWLVAAMFDDAVECIVRNVDARCGTRRRQFLEARDMRVRQLPLAELKSVHLRHLTSIGVKESA